MSRDHIQQRSHTAEITYKPIPEEGDPDTKEIPIKQMKIFCTKSNARICSALILLSTTTACFPVYQKLSVPEIPVKLLGSFSTKDHPVLLIPVLKSETSDKSLLGSPRYFLPSSTLESFESGWRVDSPFGIVLGERYIVEELCLISKDLKVLSLRRKINGEIPSTFWREKFIGALREEGRLFLIHNLQIAEDSFPPPEEVLSACSFDKRRAKADWNSRERRLMIDFLK